MCNENEWIGVKHALHILRQQPPPEDPGTGSNMGGKLEIARKSICSASNINIVMDRDDQCHWLQAEGQIMAYQNLWIRHRRTLSRTDGDTL